MRTSTGVLCELKTMSVHPPSPMLLCLVRDPDDDTLFSLGPIEYFKFLQSQLKSMSSVSPPAVVLDVAHCCVEGIRCMKWTYFIHLKCMK